MEIMGLLLDIVNDGMTLGPGLAILCIVSVVFTSYSFCRPLCESLVMVRR